MKLFTPNETKTLSKKQTSEDVVRIAYLQGTLNRLQKQTNDASASFKALLAEQRQIYSEEKEKLQAEVRELVNQVNALEARKANALIPVQGLKAEAEKALAEATKLLAENEKRAEELEEMTQVLTERTDAVSTREQVAEEKEVALNSKIEGALREADIISSSHQRLNKMLADFQSRVESTDASLARRENAIQERERLHAQAVEEHIKRVTAEERSLADRRAALDRAFGELKRLKKQ